MSWGYAQPLEEQMPGEVKALLKRAEEVDEQAAPETDIPAELARREQRLAAIKRAQEEIKRRAGARFKAEQAEYEAKLKACRDKQVKSGQKAKGREPKPPEAGPRDKDQMNFTDKASRIMPASEGFVQVCNAQAGVDNASHLMVTHHVTQQTNEKGEVAPTLKETLIEPMIPSWHGQSHIFYSIWFRVSTLQRAFCAFWAHLTCQAAIND